MVSPLGLLFTYQSPATPVATLIAAPSFPVITATASITAYTPGPLALYGAANVRRWRVGDDMVVNGSNQLTAWPDRTGNSALTSIVGAPIVTPTNAALNNLKTVLLDGLTQYITDTITHPAPGTEPTAIVLIGRQVASTSGRAIFGAGSNVLSLNQSTSPSVLMRNTTSANTNIGWTIGAWKLVIVYFSNSPSDYIKVGGASPTTTTSAGNTAPGSVITFGGRTSGASLSNIELHEIWDLKVDPMTQSAGMFAYFNSKLPPSVTT